MSFLLHPGDCVLLSKIINQIISSDCYVRAAQGTRGFPSHDYSWFGFIGYLTHVVANTMPEHM